MHLPKKMAIVKGSTIAIRSEKILVTRGSRPSNAVSVLPCSLAWHFKLMSPAKMRQAWEVYRAAHVAVIGKAWAFLADLAVSIVPAPPY